MESIEGVQEIFMYIEFQRWAFTVVRDVHTPCDEMKREKDDPPSC